MIIKTKQTTEHEVEITIPFFRKRVENGFTELFSMLTEGYVHECHEAQESQSVAVRPKWVRESDIVRVYNEWEEISEGEFLTAYRRILYGLSLDPVLTEGADDLKHVNI